MTDDLTFFNWSVAGSYQWVTGVSLGSIASGKSREERFLITAKSAQSYSPQKAECTGLFRHLAQTPPTEEGVLGFAKRYGSLGHKPELVMLESVKHAGPAYDQLGESLEKSRRRYLEQAKVRPLRRKDVELTEEQQALLMKLKQSRKGEAGVVGESLNSWLRAIGDLRDAVVLWDNVRGKQQNASAPVSLVTEAPNGSEYLHPWGLLGQLINSGLKGHGVAANLVWLPTRGRRNSNQQRSAFVLQFVPNSLLGFCWLQLAKAVEGHKEYRQCANCQNWFEIGGQATRSDRRFCTPTCKSAAHQKKQTRARQLARAGTSLQGIASQLDTDISTVKRWLD